MVAPEQIITEIDGLERKINQFLLAMQIMDNARMRKKNEPAIKYYAKDGYEFLISTTSPQIVVDAIEKYEQGEPCGYILGGGFDCLADIVMASSPVSLPSTLPQAALKLQRLIGIFTSAEDFSGPYLVEHQLRNYFLIMEELCNEKKNMGISKPDFYDELQTIRDFISHGIIDRRKTRESILNKFPELKAKDGEAEKEYIQFDNTQSSHINFIWTYRDKAKIWVKEQLTHLSNS